MQHQDFFNNRHSVRRFKPEPIDTMLLDDMLLAAVHAPNTGNMQAVAAIVTTDADLRRQLAPAHFNQPCVTEAAAVITFCADFNRFEQWCLRNNANPGFDNLQSLLAGVIDASVLAQQFCTIAEMNGLGTVYLGTTLYNAAEIAKTLHLPRRCVPVITVACGYPADDAPIGATERLPLDALIHRGTYRPFSDDDIDRLHHEQDNSEAAKGFIAQNNKATLAQVFTDIRYPKATSDAFSRTLRDYLIDCGFKL